MSQERNVRNGIIVALCITVLCMGVGFAYMSQNLNINGSATVEDATFDPQITAITPTTTLGGAVNDTAVTGVEGTTTAKFGVTLTAPGDGITYTVTLENNGTIPVDVTSITPGANTGTEGIEFTYDQDLVGTTLTTGQTATMTVSVNYLSTATALATAGTYNYSLTILCSQHVG